MTIRMKMVWMMTAWLICILLALNLLIYLLFIHLATDNEREMQLSKIDNIAENVDASILMRKHNANTLLNFLPDNSMLRVLDRNSRTINQVSNDPIAASVRPVFSTQPITSVDTVKGNKVLVIEEPILKVDGTVLGSLVLAETMLSLEGNIRVLIYLLLFSSIGAVLLCFIGGWLLSGKIINPITRMILAMEEVERSLVFKKIPFMDKSKDELSKLAATFNRMMERIEQSFVKQRQFVSDASHELRTPITIIESYVNLLRRWGKQDEKVRDESLAAIHEESRRMKQLIQQLLELAAFEKEDEIHKEAIDVESLVRESAKLFETMNGRTINISASEGPNLVMADRNKLKQVLIILLDNAMKYSEDEIVVRIWNDENYTNITVQDYGVGIANNELDLIFERFYRVDKSRQRETGGSGLGLSIAKAIVTKHGGRIDVESEVGKGTQIRVSIPRH